jgi:outer membrane protein assembly factor BamB
LADTADRPVAASVMAGDVGRSGVVAARGVRALTGPLWTYELDAPVLAAPALAGDLVVVGDSDGRVRALGAADGRPRWLAQLDGAVRSPLAVTADTVYAGVDGEAVYALDRRDGTVRWRAVADGINERRHPSPAVFPTVVGGLLVFRSMWAVKALDLATGARRWSTYGSDVHAFHEGRGSCLAIGDGLAVFARGGTDANQFESSLTALDVTSGEHIWTFFDGSAVSAEQWQSHDEWPDQADEPYEKPANTVGVEHPVVRDGLVHVVDEPWWPEGDRDRWGLWVLDLRTGETVRHIELPAGVALLHPPVVTDERLWFTSTRLAGSRRWATATLWTCLRAGGAPRAVLDLGADPVGPLLVAAGVAYVAGDGGLVRAVDTATATILWEHPTGLPEPALTVADGVVYVAADRTVVALAGEP